jgi:hypothetical protein
MTLAAGCGKSVSLTVMVAPLSVVSVPLVRAHQLL